MSWEAWLTLGVLVGTLVVLARETYPPSVPILSATVLLLVAGVITPEQAFSGFSNPAPITVAALFVLARAVEQSGALQPLLNATMGNPRGTRGALVRLLFPTAAASAFLNNTPIVAMLVPQISDWARRRGLSPSRFLLPLSYATILGGTVTAIGTSTNLVISGLLESAGYEPLGMFELSAIGFPLAVVGVGILVLAAPILLPDRVAVGEATTDEAIREFVVTMRVEPAGPVDGRTVAEGGLRHLQGVFLVEIERDGERIAPVAPATTLRGDDRLVFVGRADEVVDLQRIGGLVSTERSHLVELDTPGHTFFEVVIGPSSPLTGKTLREADFRNQFQAAVVAIHRAGQRVRRKLGAVTLRVGDTLVLLSDSGFRERWRDRNVFLLVAPLGSGEGTAQRRAGVVGLVAVAIVLGAAFGILPILHLSLLGAVVLVLTGVLTPGQARASIDLDILLVIAGAFGLGAAMEASGLAERLGHGMTVVLNPFGPVGVLAGLVLATTALKSVISNNATAVLMFPVAMGVAVELGMNERTLALTLAIAASSSFLTPIAYQTNLMVYGPGGYRFGDYARLGAPLSLLVLLTVAFLVPIVWPL